MEELRVDRAWFQRLKLKYDEPLSNFAFNFNLRLYTKGARMYLYKEFGTRRTNGFDGLIGSEVFDAFFRLGQTMRK